MLKMKLDDHKIDFITGLVLIVLFNQSSTMNQQGGMWVYGTIGVGFLLLSLIKLFSKIEK